MAARITFRRGSTWPDVLAVIVVIGVLTGITIPMMLSARLHASRARCTDNLREIGSALDKYAQDNQGRLPSTRPSGGATSRPDVSSSGSAARSPFDSDGPAANNVPAALFLLVRTGLLNASTLVCPGSDCHPDRFDGQLPSERSNFTDVSANLSYAMQNPYPDASVLARGYQWRLDFPPDFVLVADRGPDSSLMKGLTVNSPRDRMRYANSTNHDRYGQNVLYADGRVDFATTPFVGVNQDHIYLSKAGRQLDSPQDATDNVLLPGEN